MAMRERALIHVTQDLDRCMEDVAALQETVQQQTAAIASLQAQVRAMRK